MPDRSATCPRCGTRLAGGSPLGELCPRCLLSLGVDPHGEVPAVDAPGTRFGAYQLLEQVGEGGMGVVWRAQQEHPIRRVVALKVVKPGGDSRQVLIRFESERQALAILNHPNIAVVFDAGITPDGRPYFVMEYVPGLPITAFADREALPIPARLELFLQVCDGVQHAHQKGLLHRDLKPTNILVTNQDGRAVVKIIDFGVAKAIGPQMHAETVETQVGVLLGTPEYMSPEQAGLTEASVDTRTDIYSLGLVLYELLVGALPFDAQELRQKAVLEMLRVIREDEPPRLTLRLTSQSDANIQEIARRRLTEPGTLRRQLQGDLEWITGRALEKEPSRRYPSASELRADVHRHLWNEPVLAGPPSMAYRVRKFVRRHRGLAAVSAALAATILAGAVLATVLWLRSERARVETRRQLVASLVARGVARMDAWDWAGGLLLFTKALEIEPDRGREREHRIRVAQVLQRMPRLVRVWSHGLRIRSVDVSNQGIVASAGTDGAVRVWSLQTGHEIGEPYQHRDAVHHVVFSPDGRWLASASEDGTARLRRASDGGLIEPPMRHAKGVRYVAFSPDSQVLATAGADGWAKLWRIGEEKPYAQINLGTDLVRIVFRRDGTQFAVAARSLDSEPFAVRLWFTKDGSPAGNWIRGRPGWSLFDMDLAPDGVHVVTAGNQDCHCARLWDASTGKPVGNALMHRNIVPTTRFNATGTQIVTGGYDRVVQTWTVPKGEPAAAPWTINGWPELVRFTGDGQLLAATATGAVELVAPGASAAREHSRIFPTLTHAGPVTAATLDGSGRFLVTGSGDGGVRVWDLAPTLMTDAPFAWYASEWVSDVIFSNRGSLATAARLFDTNSGLPVVPPLRAESDDYTIALSRDGTRVATSGRHLARVWDATTGEPVSPVLAHDGDLTAVQSLVFSPDGRRLLTLSSSNGKGEATVWDIATATRAGTFKHDAAVTVGAFSSDGTRLLTGSHERDTNLRIWLLGRGSLVFSGRHPEGVQSASFDGSDDRIVTIGFDQRVFEWRVGSTLTSREALELHTEPILLSRSREGTLVAGGRGGDIRVRTGRSGDEPIMNLQQTGAVMSADISPDEEWLVASGDDGRANLWSLQSGERISPAYWLGGPMYAVRFSPDGGSFAISGAGVHLQALVPDERPIPFLNDLAELLSARRLVNAGDSPLRLEDLAARWNAVSAVQPNAIANPPAGWLRRDAAFAFRRGDMALVLDHLASLRRTGRMSWSDTMFLLASLAKAGRWLDAVSEVQGLAAARDAAPELVFMETVAKRRAGDAHAPLAACRELLRRHAATRNPDRALWILRICLLDPHAADEPERQSMAHLLERVVDLRAFGTRESLAGALAVRSGRFDDAIDLLQRAAVGNERTPHTMLFLAMAYARTNKPAEAKHWLLESEKFVWPPALTGSQRVFRESWFGAEAAMLSDEIQTILRTSDQPPFNAR